MQTGPIAQINVCMRFRAKDLEPQNQSTSLVRLDTEPVFKFTLNNSSILSLWGSLWGIMQKENCAACFFVKIIVTDKTNNNKCSFPVLKFKRTPKKGSVTSCTCFKVITFKVITSAAAAFSGQRTVLVQGKRKNSLVFVPVVKSLHKLWASLRNFKNL